MMILTSVFGLQPSQVQTPAGWRPWLRRGCARRIDEAREQPADLGADESSLRLRKEFEREFALELRRSDWPAARKF